jgi:hypothetical protein
MNSNQKTKLESHVNSLVKHLIRWTKEHQASITPSVNGLCEGTLPKKTASSLRAILASFSPEVFLVASKLLCDVEDMHGPIPDVLLTADAVRTHRGYILKAVYVEGVV